jgi:hypothetical protein
LDTPTQIPRFLKCAGKRKQKLLRIAHDKFLWEKTEHVGRTTLQHLVDLLDQLGINSRRLILKFLFRRGGEMNERISM